MRVKPRPLANIYILSLLTVYAQLLAVHTVYRFGKKQRHFVVSIYINKIKIQFVVEGEGA